MNLTAVGLGLCGLSSHPCVCWDLFSPLGAFALLFGIGGEPGLFQRAELQVAALCDRSQMRVKGAGGEAGDYPLTVMTQPSIK